jgi:murein DD-endopeptidase MepM/ murein hydrolase activator NlpD
MMVKTNSQQTGIMRLGALLLGSWLLSSCAAVQAQTDQTVVNGGLWSVPVTAEVLTQAAQGNPLRYQDRPVWVGLVNNQPTAMIGIGLSDIGTQQLVNSRGELIAATTVRERAYAEQHLRLTQTQYVTPNIEQNARFEREAAEQKAAYRVYSGQTAAQWPVFQWPLHGRVSSEFGLRRFFNGEPRAPHLGIDIAGKQGTPVLAPAEGAVALIGDYFFNGRTVIIDHGQGLFSMLCHFSDIQVTVGQQVTKRTVVGLVGATGRATAPHLHWTVSLNDSRINPAILLPVQKKN